MAPVAMVVYKRFILTLPTCLLDCRPRTHRGIQSPGARRPLPCARHVARRKWQVCDDDSLCLSQACLFTTSCLREMRDYLA